MAFTINRKISIQWKLNPDAFAIMNKSAINDIIRKFGSDTNAVNAMLVKKDLLDMIMPILVGMTPTDLGWQKTISNYWHSISIDIPESGKELEVGFIFDLNDNIRANNIKELKLKNKSINSDEDLGNIVMSLVNEDEKYKYGTPIKAEDYLLWIYSKKYRDVANSVSDINKSPYIRFYIHDETITKEQKKAAVKLTMMAQEKFIELVKSNDSIDKIYNLLCVIEPTNIVNLDKLTTDEKQIRLFDIFSKNPSTFIDIIDDKNLHIKALIEKLLSKHILRKMLNTDVIVDVEDPSIILGNTTNEAVSWFSSEQNNAKISEYKIRLKQK